MSGHGLILGHGVVYQAELVIEVCEVEDDLGTGVIKMEGLLVNGNSLGVKAVLGIIFGGFAVIFYRVFLVLLLGK